MSKIIADPAPSKAEQIHRLLWTLSLATPDEVAAGTHWYDVMQSLARAFADRFGYTVAQAACVLAAHSMNASWRVNVDRAAKQMAGNPVGLKRAIAMADKALADRVDPFRHIVGPKINPFARCGAGDLSFVATDRWAQRAAYGTMDDKACDRWIGRKGERDNMIQAYVEAAAIAGLEPAVLQAIVWVVVRGKAD